MSISLFFSKTFILVFFPSTSCRTDGDTMLGLLSLSLSLSFNYMMQFKSNKPEFWIGLQLRQLIATDFSPKKYYYVINIHIIVCNLTL
jgi:hypothetical protein